MNIWFIKKRIWEQKMYILAVNESNISPERKTEIINSANGVLRYFEDKEMLSTEPRNWCSFHKD